MCPRHKQRPILPNVSTAKGTSLLNCLRVTKCCCFKWQTFSSSFDASNNPFLHAGKLFTDVYFFLFFYPADSLSTMKHLLQSAQVESSHSSSLFFDFLQVLFSHNGVLCSTSQSVRRKSHLHSDPLWMPVSAVKGNEWGEVTAVPQSSGCCVASCPLTTVAIRRAFGNFLHSWPFTVSVSPPTELQQQCLRPTLRIFTGSSTRGQGEPQVENAARASSSLALPLWLCLACLTLPSTLLLALSFAVS